MRKLLFTILLLLLTSAVIAQPAAPTPAPDRPEGKQPPTLDMTNVPLPRPELPRFPEPQQVLPILDIQVNNVQLTGVNDGQLTFTVQGVQVDGCEYPLTSSERTDGDFIFVDIARTRTDDPEAADVSCSSEPAPFEIAVTLTERYTEEMLRSGDLFLIVNDFAAQIGSLLADKPTDSPVVSDITLRPRLRSPLLIETIDIRETDGDYRLYVTGTHPSGCRAPVVEQMTIKDGTISVLIYRLDDFFAEICPAVLLLYESEFDLPDDLMDVYTLQVNSETLLYDFNTDEGVEVRQVRTVIESVQPVILESFPPQIHLLVEGYQPDGCASPVKVDQRQEDNTIYVDIFRELPSDTACPAVIVPYDETIRLGSFEPGTYTIIVNDFEVTVTI